MLNSEPLCRECKKHGRLTLATEVDHIIPLSKGGDNSPGNLQPLCHACHSRKTASEDGGFGNTSSDTLEG
ncbi:HNH endonuclease [Mesotoga sp.]|uniref:HNH endonuclease n=1 Tax=Mesotoga sp. TaxID=2053577 RepID=UPI00345EBBA0